MIVELTLGGETIETTPEHPFYVLLRGWVEAGALYPGLAVRQADGAYGAVEQVALVQRSQRMYNLTVAEAHTFFVGDEAWLVHNACNIQKFYRGSIAPINMPLGAADPDDFGEQLANAAKAIRTNLKFTKDTTVAVTEVAGTYFVTVYGGTRGSTRRAVERYVTDVAAQSFGVTVREQARMRRRD